MMRNIADRASYLAQHSLRARMRWVEASEEMRYLREAHGRVVNDPRFQQFIHARRRATLQDVDIDAGIEQQFRARRSRCLDHWQSVDRAAPDRIRCALRLDPPQTAREIKAQGRCLAR